MSSDPALRVLGFDVDEWWVGRDEFLKVRDIQQDEIGGIDELPIDSIEAFEDGPFGWGRAFGTIRKGDTATPLRVVAVFRLEAGSWKVIQWTNSVPVPNQQVFGVDLTTTLDTLDNRRIIIPNSEVIGTVIENYTHNEVRRVVKAREDARVYHVTLEGSEVVETELPGELIA